MKEFRYSLPIRLAALAFLTVVVQQAAVSQISIFGVNADLTPLVVVSVGLLAGSMLGAIMGFATGLLVDLVLVQTLGVTSLLYIAIGYWSGRLRELRDPAHGLVPLAMGAAATAVAGIGMAFIQFLLGVDAPVSFLLAQQIFITILVNTLIALPVYSLVRRIVQPALPDDPRRRRRRAYTTGGLSPLQRPSERLGPIPRSALMIQLARRPAPAVDAAARDAGGDARHASRWRCSRSSSSASGSSRCSRGISTSRRRGVTGRATSRSRRSGARSSTRTATSSSTAGRPIAVQIAPVPDLPKAPVRRASVLYGRLATILGISTKPKSLSGRRPRRPVPGADRVPGRSAARAAALRQRDGQDRRRQRTSSTTWPSARTSSPASTCSRSTCASIRSTSSPRSCSGPSGRSAQHEVQRLRRFRGVPQNAIVGQSGLEWYYDHYLRGNDGADRVQVDSLGRFKGYLAPDTAPVAGHTLKLSLDVGLQKAGQQALQEAINNNPPATAGRVRGHEPRQRRGLRRWARSRPSTRTSSPSRCRQSIYSQLNNPASGFPLFNRAIQSAYPTGSTFKAITATAALQSGAWSLGDSYDDTGQLLERPRRHPPQRRPRRHTACSTSSTRSSVSSDDFFYNLGALTNSDPTTHPRGGALQNWARTSTGSGSRPASTSAARSSGSCRRRAGGPARNKLELAVRAGTGP